MVPPSFFSGWANTGSHERRALGAEDATGKGNVVRAEGVHPHISESRHRHRVVDRPGYDPASRGVRDRHKFTVNRWPLTPKVAAAHSLQGVEVVYGVADFEYPARHPGRYLARLGNLPVVKRVYRTLHTGLDEGPEGSCSRLCSLELSVGVKPQLSMERECVEEAGDALRDRVSWR